MKIVKVALTVAALMCLAGTSGLARATDAHRSSSKGSGKQSRTAHAKGAGAKRKGTAAKASRSRRGVEKKGELSGTHDIDVSGATFQDLPAEELPVAEPGETDDDNAPPLIP
jgi:hypothetical protein